MADNSESGCELISKEEYEKLKGKQSFQIVMPDADSASTSDLEKKWFKWWRIQQQKHGNIPCEIGSSMSAIYRRPEILEGKTLESEVQDNKPAATIHTTEIPIGEGTLDEEDKIFDEILRQRGDKKRAQGTTSPDSEWPLVKLEDCDPLYATCDCEAYEADFLKDIARKHEGRDSMSARIAAQEAELKEGMDDNPETSDEEEHPRSCTECGIEALKLWEKCNYGLDDIDAMIDDPCVYFNYYV